MGMYKYRIFSAGNKADSIEDCKAAVEHAIPHGGILWVQLANN